MENTQHIILGSLGENWTKHRILQAYIFALKKRNKWKLCMRSADVKSIIIYVHTYQVNLISRREIFNFAIQHCILSIGAFLAGCGARTELGPL